MMGRFSFWVVWLQVVSVVFILFGVCLALFNQSDAFNILFNNQINIIFFGMSDITSELKSFQQWIYGLLGATCVLVGILILFIVKYAFAKKENWSRYCIFTGIVGWFILDEFISLYFAVYVNAIFNLILLIVIILPLLCTKNHFNNKNLKVWCWINCCLNLT